MDLVRAAGGVVWRPGPAGPRLAVIHRPHRADWSLPKGKLDGGESWQHAALREVAEETGCEARIACFAGAKLRLDRERPKLVVYWHMRFVRDGLPHDREEVDEVAWLSPRQALARLDRASDKRLLLRSLRGATWRSGEGVREPGRETLRRLLLLDSPRSAEELRPFLDLVARAVDGAASRRARTSSLPFRWTAVGPRGASVRRLVADRQPGR